jgi:hypothetical protein
MTEEDKSNWFPYGLFNVDVNGSDYMASNFRIISEQWIGKDVEGIDRGLI